MSISSSLVLIPLSFKNSSVRVTNSFSKSSFVLFSEVFISLLKLSKSRLNSQFCISDEAYNMIVNGECGQFPPDILECFKFAKEKFSNIVELNEMYDFS